MICSHGGEAKGDFRRFQVTDAPKEASRWLLFGLVQESNKACEKHSSTFKKLGAGPG